MSFRKPALGLAAATAALTLGAAGAASAAQLTSSYDFNNSLAPSYNSVVEDEPLSASGTTANATEAPYGAVRTFSAPYGAFFAQEVTDANGASSVAFFFNVDDTDPDAAADTVVRLIDFSSFSADTADVVLHDGKIAYSNNDGTFTDGPDLADDTWTELTVTREANGDRKVYRDDTLLFTVPAAKVRPRSGEFVLFNDNEGEATPASGAIARLRTWRGALTASEVDALTHGIDASDPFDLELSDDDYGSLVDGGTRWVGPEGYFAGRVKDDGSVPAITLQLLNGSGGTVGGAITDTYTYGIDELAGFNSILTSWGSDVGLGSFANDATGKLRVTATDKRGNDTQKEFDFKVDRQAPTGFAINAIGETTSRKPTASGTANVGPRDFSSVSVSLCKGDKCEYDVKDDFIAYATAEIKDGKWSTSDWKRWDEKERKYVAMGDQPNGDYVVEGSHEDRLYNVAHASQKLKIADPKPAVVTPPVVVTPPLPLAPAQAFTQRLLANQVAFLARLKLSALRKTWSVGIPTTVDRPATVIYQWFFGAAPKTVDPKAKAAAAKKKKKAKNAKKSNLIASGSRVFPAPGSAPITVKVNAFGKRLLKKQKRARISVRAIVITPGAKLVAQDAKVTLAK